MTSPTEPETEKAAAARVAKRARPGRPAGDYSPAYRSVVPKGHFASYPAMKPFVMQVRRQAYAEILDRGLLAIREAARVGNLRICEIEAGHIHNLPSLLHEANEARHHCYIGQERVWYMTRLRELVGTDPEYVADRMRFYGKP